MNKCQTYIGRFAPSPTGGLHFGSLLAALASYLQAKANNGQWFLRIEDIDPPREVRGAKDDIQRTLECYNLYWDDKTIYQSRNLTAYQDALSKIIHQQKAFYCACSRSQLKPFPTYPGFCRNKNLQGLHAIRCQVADIKIAINDQIQGDKSWLLKDVGDFIIKRADGLFSYQLAVSADDAALGVTEVVRGVDLINETPKQIYLQQLLGYPTPFYAHIPTAHNKNGYKLSKQTGAPVIPITHKADIAKTLVKALAFLQQKPVTGLHEAEITDILSWAVNNWDMKKMA